MYTNRLILSQLLANRNPQCIKQANRKLGNGWDILSIWNGLQANEGSGNRFVCVEGVLFLLGRTNFLVIH